MSFSNKYIAKIIPYNYYTDAENHELNRFSSYYNVY